MYFLVNIKFYYTGVFLYILIKIESSTSGNTAKKTEQKHVKTGFVES